jgi:hypothetical protein
MEPAVSFEDGWSALNLEMTARVPHTEYSLERHWELVNRVTGLQVDPHSPDEIQTQAAFAFMKAWNYDFRWSTHVGCELLFGDLRTDMGHAEYAAGGVDRRDTIYCPFKTPEEVLAFDFYAAYGTIDQAEWKARFEAFYRQACQETPDMVNMTGIYDTLISAFIDIFGWDMLLLAAGTDPLAFGELANRYTAWIGQYFAALAATDVPVVMIHDDMVWTSGPIFAPQWYRQFVFPNYKKLFMPLRNSGKKIMFTSDGNYTRFIDDIAGCGVHGFIMEPMTDMAYIAEKYGRTHVFIGNADTRILLNGNREQIQAEVARCMSIGKPYPGFFMAVGNHIPSNTPVENILCYEDTYEQLSRR